jgi:hypothetical protein
MSVQAINRTSRLIIASALIAALLCGNSCSRDTALLAIYVAPAIVLLAVVTGVVLLVSDADATPAPAWDCSVVNHTAQAFRLYDSGEALGDIGSGGTCSYVLGAGAHELYCQPLEYGREYYNLRKLLDIQDGQHWQITLEQLD